jgi:hypothetical protein
MKLLEAMLSTKIALTQMEKYLLSKCSHLGAREELLQVVRQQKAALYQIDKLISEGRYEGALICISSHVYPRKKDYFIRDNYDYGEFWPKVMEEFKDGKVKDVVEYSRKLRRWPKGKDESTKDSNEKRVDTKSDNPDKKKKKRVQRASDDSMIPTESYCGSERNKKYWKQLKKLKKNDDEEHDDAIEDFLKYIEEIKC